MRFYFYFLQDLVALVHQQGAVVEEQSMTIVEHAKINKRQSGIIQDLIMTVEKQSMTNKQLLLTVDEQSVLIQQLQDETAVSHNEINN